MNVNRVQEIVVGVDGSDAADAAVGYALTVARRLHAPVRLVHTVPAYSPLPPLSMLTGDILLDNGRALLARVAHRADLAAPDVEILTALRIGPRGAELVQAAKEAQLVVLGRGSRVDRIVSGSTAARVAVHAVCPVQVVPTDWSPGAADGRVVVGLKDVDTSEDLLRRGFVLAGQRGGELLVLHAWHLPPGYEQIITAPDVDAWNAHAKARIEHALKPIRADFPEVPVEISIVQAKPTDALVEASASAGLLLVGRRSHRRPFDKLGSVARTMQRSGLCPVEVGPASGERVPEDDLVLESGGAMLR